MQKITDLELQNAALLQELHEVRRWVRTQERAILRMFDPNVYPNARLTRGKYGYKVYLPSESQ